MMLLRRSGISQWLPSVLIEALFRASQHNTEHLFLHPVLRSYSATLRKVRHFPKGSAAGVLQVFALNGSLQPPSGAHVHISHELPRSSFSRSDRPTRGP